MIQRSLEAGLREPEFEITDGFVVRIFKRTGQVSSPNGQVGGQVLSENGQVEPWVLPVLLLCQSAPRSSREVQEAAGITHRESFQRNYLDLLLERKWLERTVPDKPQSRNQKYRLTDSGEAVLLRLGKQSSLE